MAPFFLTEDVRGSPQRSRPLNKSLRSRGHDNPVITKVSSYERVIVDPARLYSIVVSWIFSADATGEFVSSSMGRLRPE